MSRSNLSAWAVAHPTLILFLILMVAGAGAFSYAKLGRAEDPSFTIKTVVISAVWPGAAAQEMQFQVADRIEKKLQELPWFDVVKTYSKPGIMLAQLEFRDSPLAVLSHATKNGGREVRPPGRSDRAKRE